MSLEYLNKHALDRDHMEIPLASTHERRVVFVVVVSGGGGSSTVLHRSQEEKSAYLVNLP